VDRHGVVISIYKDQVKMKNRIEDDKVKEKKKNLSS